MFISKKWDKMCCWECSEETSRVLKWGFGCADSIHRRGTYHWGDQGLGRTNYRLFVFIWRLFTCWLQWGRHLQDARQANRTYGLIGLKLYCEHVRYPHGTAELYGHMTKAHCGMLKSMLWFYEKARADLEADRFDINNYNSCVVNKMINNGLQMTVI